jgi:glycosyltransferase involved in cell wall biosynthesis
MLRSFSVIVPVLNKRGDILRTLTSIGASLAYVDAHHPRAADLRGEVVIVDEGSTDGTLDIADEWVRSEPRARLVRHFRSLGIGPARNTGVRVSTGDVLFFCDGDDLFDPEHVFIGFSILDWSSRVAAGPVPAFRLHIPGRGHVTIGGGRPLAALRTGVRIREPILDYWKNVVGRTIMQNVCVRRECHEWIEGFPEQLVYKLIGGCEDGAFTTWLTTFFTVGAVGLETVEYARRPGSSLDRQMDRFRHPPGSKFDRATPAQQVLADLRRRLEEARTTYLLDKLIALGAARLPQALTNVSGIREELQRRGRTADLGWLEPAADNRSDA